jgi:hypothetical protein
VGDVAHGDALLNHKLWRKSGRLGESGWGTSIVGHNRPRKTRFVCITGSNVVAMGCAYQPAALSPPRTAPRAGRTTGRLWAIAGRSRVAAGKDTAHRSCHQAAGRSATHRPAVCLYRPIHCTCEDIGS